MNKLLFKPGKRGYTLSSPARLSKGLFSRFFMLCKYEAQFNRLTTENMDLSKQLNTISYQKHLMEDELKSMVVEQSVLDEKYSEKLACQQNIIQQLRDGLLYQACGRGLDKIIPLNKTEELIDSDVTDEIFKIASLECKTSYKKDTSDQMLAISEKQDINNNSNSTMDAYENEIRSLRQEINDVHHVNDNLCRKLEEVNQNNEMLSRSPVSDFTPDDGRFVDAGTAADYEHHILTLQVQLEASHGVVERLQENITSHQESYSDSTEKILGLQEKLNQVLKQKGESSHRESKKDALISQLQQELSTVYTHHDELEQELTITEQLLQELTHREHNLEQTVAEIESKLNDRETCVDKMSKQIFHLEQQLHISEKTVDTYQSEQHQYQQTHQHHNYQYNLLENRIDKLQYNCVELSAQLESKARQLVATQQVGAGLREEVVYLKAHPPSVVISEEGTERNMYCSCQCHQYMLET